MAIEIFQLDLQLVYLTLMSVANSAPFLVSRRTKWSGKKRVVVGKQMQDQSLSAATIVDPELQFALCPYLLLCKSRARTASSFHSRALYALSSLFFTSTPTVYHSRLPVYT